MIFLSLRPVRSEGIPFLALVIPGGIGHTYLRLNLAGDFSNLKADLNTLGHKYAANFNCRPLWKVYRTI